jgi:hypothetical protein
MQELQLKARCPHCTGLSRFPYLPAMVGWMPLLSHGLTSTWFVTNGLPLIGTTLSWTLGVTPIPVLVVSPFTPVCPPASLP